MARKNSLPTITAPAVGPREAEAQAMLDGFLATQAEAREQLASLRSELPAAVAERDRLDAVIGTADEDDRAFTRLGDADTRVTSIERRIAQAEADAQQADHNIASARVTVRYRRAQDLADWLATPTARRTMRRSWLRFSRCLKITSRACTCVMRRRSRLHALSHPRRAPSEVELVYPRPP